MAMQSKYDRNKHRSTKWPKVRQLALNRDRKANAVCWICGQPIDYLATPSTTPDSWEPDHDPPVSKAPQFELDLKHIKPAHKMCNRAKGSGDHEPIGQQSRVW